MLRLINYNLRTWNRIAIFECFSLDKFYMLKDKLLLAKNTKNEYKQNGPIDIYLWEFTSISFHGQTIAPTVKSYINWWWLRLSPLRWNHTSIGDVFLQSSRISSIQPNFCNSNKDYLHKNKISLEPLSSLFLFKNLIKIHSIIINKKLKMLFFLLGI